MFNAMFWFTFAYPQDIHFAQYMYSPLNQNPALAGFFNGDYRITANHREQWNSISVPYKTYAASFDMKVVPISTGRNQVNAGLLLNSDKAGDSEFGTLDAELAASWLHFAGSDSQHVLSGGIQVGIIQRSINYNKLTFDNQFNGDVFDPTISPGENFEVSHFYYFNFSAGAAWKYKISKSVTCVTGASLQHLNKPKQSFFKEKNVRLPMRLQLNLQGSVVLNDWICLQPDIAWMKQNTFSELLAGAQFKFILSQKPGKQYACYLGLEGRLKDAIIPVIGFDYNTLHVGISYDVNTSRLKRASNRKGGLELSLMYIIKKVSRTGIKPPCVIY